MICQHCTLNLFYSFPLLDAGISCRVSLDGSACSLAFSNEELGSGREQPPVQYVIRDKRCEPLIHRCGDEGEKTHWGMSGERRESWTEGPAEWMRRRNKEETGGEDDL